MATRVGLEKVFLVNHMRKPCSKFGEDRSINDVTIFSTDAGHQWLYTPSDLVLSPMLLCIALDRQ